MLELLIAGYKDDTQLNGRLVVPVLQIDLLLLKSFGHLLHARQYRRQVYAPDIYMVGSFAQANNFKYPFKERLR